MTRISITTDIPARLNRLPWSRFHLLVVVALGVTWILDGLEVTIVGSIGPVLQNSQTLGLSAQEIGSAGSAYVIGAVVGALLFGWLTDRFGRRLVFYLTLIVYLAAVLLSATSWDFWSCSFSRNHGIRHRRRICRYQFSNRRADSRQFSGSRRSYRQWQFLARRGSGLRGVTFIS
jgi:MFS family permease